MKKYKVGKYVVTAKDAVQAARIVSNIDSKKYVIFKQNGVYKMTTEENYARPIQNAREITSFNNMSSKDEIIEYVEKYLGGMNGIRFVDSYAKNDITDAANEIDTLKALVSDEEAAIDAYNIAIANIGEGDIKKVLIAIRDDEERHIENLYAAINGTVEQKNLEDNIHDGINECHEALAEAKDAISMIYKNYAKEQDSKYMLEKLNNASSAIARAVRHYKAWM